MSLKFEYTKIVKGFYMNPLKNSKELYLYRWISDW